MNSEKLRIAWQATLHHSLAGNFCLYWQHSRGKRPPIEQEPKREDNYEENSFSACRHVFVSRDANAGADFESAIVIQQQSAKHKHTAAEPKHTAAEPKQPAAESGQPVAAIARFNFRIGHAPEQ